MLFTHSHRLIIPLELLSIGPVKIGHFFSFFEFFIGAEVEITLQKFVDDIVIDFFIIFDLFAGLYGNSGDHYDEFKQEESRVSRVFEVRIGEIFRIAIH